MPTVFKNYLCFEDEIREKNRFIQKELTCIKRNVKKQTHAKLNNET